MTSLYVLMMVYLAQVFVVSYILAIEYTQEGRKEGDEGRAMHVERERAIVEVASPPWPTMIRRLHKRRIPLFSPGLAVRGDSALDTTNISQCLYPARPSLYVRCGFHLSRLRSLVRPWKTFPTRQGLHNWIQIYSEEKKGKLDYMGYIFPRQRGYADTPAEDEQLITVQVRASLKHNPDRGQKRAFCFVFKDCSRLLSYVAFVLYTFMQVDVNTILKGAITAGSSILLLNPQRGICLYVRREELRWRSEGDARTPRSGNGALTFVCCISLPVPCSSSGTGS